MRAAASPPCTPPRREPSGTQVLHLRNRLSQMGASPQYINDDLPCFNAWIEGEGGYRKLDDRMDESGYKLNTWGGTFGFDVTCSDSFVWGAAFSASYGDLDAYMANGDLDSYYGNLFFRIQSGRWAHNVILTYGWNDASLDRTAASRSRHVRHARQHQRQQLWRLL